MINFDNIPLSVKRCPDYDPAPGIEAITYNGLPIGGSRTKVFAYVGIPQSDHPLPGIVLVHGGGGHAFHCWVKMWNDHGYAAIAMDTTGFFPSEKGAGKSEGCPSWVHGPSGDFAEDGVVTAPTNDSMNIAGKPEDEQWMSHAVSSVITARRLLAADPRVDAERIGLTGISWGGVITSLVIGYDPAFAFAVPVYGSGYLGEKTLGSIRHCFLSDEVKKTWLAEDRFDRVKMPVLWYCWNDDNNFSIQANSCSYLDTAGANPDTALSIVDNMHHSHVNGWRRPEPMVYADSVVLGGPKMPRILSQPQGKHPAFRVDPRDSRIVSATAYTIDSPMTYSPQKKFGFGPYTYMDQVWRKHPCTLDGGTVFCDLPEDTAAYYIELEAETGSERVIVTTAFIEI